MKQKRIIQSVVPNIPWNKISIVGMIEKRSMTDLTTSLSVTSIFVLALLPASIVNELDPEQTRFVRCILFYFCSFSGFRVALSPVPVLYLLD